MAATPDPPQVADARRGPRAARVLLLWLAALAVGVALIWRTPFTADLSAFLPAAPDASQRLLIEQIRAGAPARTWMMAIEGASADERAALSKRLAQALRASGRFEQVHSGDRGDYAALARWVVEHRYALSPAVTRAHFEADGLAAAIDETLSLLGTPAGALVKPILERDPTGESLRIAEASLAGGGPATRGGVWVSRDGRRALLIAVGRADGRDLDAADATLAEVRRAFAALSPGAATLLVSGTPKFSVDSRARIEREATQLAIVGTLLMGALLWLAFRRPTALAIALLPVASGVVAGIAAVGLAFGHVHGMTLGFGSTLIGEAVDYAIYYLVQAGLPVAAGPSAAAPVARAGWRHWVRTGWPTVRLGVVTSVLGFAALLFSGFVGLAQLGVFTIAGLVGAAATARWVLPVLAPDGAPTGALVARLGAAGRRLVAFAPRLRVLVLVLGVAALALLGVRRDSLWQGELSSLSPVQPHELALDAALRAEFGDPDGGAIVVVRGATADAALAAAEAASARLDALVDDGTLAGHDSPARLAPSQAAQGARRAALPDEAALRAALARATEGGPLPAARLAPFVADVQRARGAPPLPAPVRGAEVAASSPAAPLVQALLNVGEDGRWSALLPLRVLDAAQADRAVARTRAALAGLPDTHVLDIGAELRRTYRHYLGEAMRMALVGAAAIVALMAWQLRSTRRLAAVVAPLALAVLLCMGGLVALGVPLSILHLVGLLLVVAVGSNYALFFDMLAQRGDADDATLASLLLANVTTVASFGLIALSSIPALADIGRVVAPGAALSLLLAAALAGRREAASRD